MYVMDQLQVTIVVFMDLLVDVNISNVVNFPSVTISSCGYTDEKKYEFIRYLRVLNYGIILVIVVWLVSL